MNTTTDTTLDVVAAAGSSAAIAWPPAVPSGLFHAVRSPWQFEPVGRLTDLTRVSGLHRAWGTFVSALYEQNINGRAAAGQPPYAVQELKQSGASESSLRFYSPTRMDVPDGTSAVDATWVALPSRYDAQFRGDMDRTFAYLDTPQNDPLARVITRMQDEFCEWTLERDSSGRVIRIVFTAEPPDYYEFLLNPPAGIDPEESRQLLVDLYRQIADSDDVQLADLVNADGSYNRWNRWNNLACVHLQQPNNSLAALINLAARASIVRHCGGRSLADPQDLLACSGCGDPCRRSDVAIAGAVNDMAAQNRFVTLANPVAAYIAGLDTSGWTTPDGADARSFWHVLRGLDTGAPEHNNIVRAELSVPPWRGYTLSDIAIDGEPILSGAQVAARITMRLGLLASPVTTRPAPHPIGCLSGSLQSVAMPMGSQLFGRRI